MHNYIFPHGHGLSHKRGISDGLLNKKEFQNDLPHGHDKSYREGIKIGEQLRVAVHLNER